MCARALDQNVRGNKTISLEELSEDKDDEMREEIQRLRDERSCKICLEKEACIVFLPCGHLTTCAMCAPSLDKCPLCRSKIEALVRAFLTWQQLLLDFIMAHNKFYAFGLSGNKVRLETTKINCLITEGSYNKEMRLMRPTKGQWALFVSLIWVFIFKLSLFDIKIDIYNIYAKKHNQLAYKSYSGKVGFGVPLALLQLMLIQFVLMGHILWSAAMTSDKISDDLKPLKRMPLI